MNLRRCCRRVSARNSVSERSEPHLQKKIADDLVDLEKMLK